jgi:hypothetical protein
MIFMVLALNPPVLRRLAPFFKVEAPVVSKLPLEQHAREPVPKGTVSRPIPGARKRSCQ